ncbi:MAG: ACT domain-containing protein [Clostridia bacterium]|nr:ACT domain-containing protein [Clostridia bacterium]MBR2160429.1 ACT domain-containing protein [Clostridia bacterium]MBR2397632.1 ACT domain-containing protein [Clostridia bacterium]MBR2495678.1 ACT domain-containing protein [Clostridia bacterium]
MKAIVSVIGKDKKGIIAKVSNVLYNFGANILDISQTIMQNEFFTMVMMIELAQNDSIENINKELCKVANELELDIRIQHEDIFNSMHRI